MDHRLLRAESCLTPRQRTDALTASAGCGSPAGTRTAWRRDDLGTEGCPTNRFNINGRLAVPGDRGETAKMEVPAAVFGCSLSDQKEKEMNQNYKALCVVLCLGLTLGMAHVAFGQGERTSVTGTVTDNTQAIVVDASVTIRDRATHVQTKTTTNSAGLYFITNLPPRELRPHRGKNRFRDFDRDEYSADANSGRNDKRHAARRKHHSNRFCNGQCRTARVSDFGAAVDDHHEGSRGFAQYFRQPPVLRGASPERSANHRSTGARERGHRLGDHRANGGRTCPTERLFGRWR